jgi:hypothetical protein
MKDLTDTDYVPLAENAPFVIAGGNLRACGRVPACARGGRRCLDP